MRGFGRRPSIACNGEESPEYLEWVSKLIAIRKASRGHLEPIRNHERFCLTIIEGERANFRAEQAARQHEQAEREKKIEAARPMILDRIQSHLTKLWENHLYQLAAERWECGHDTDDALLAFETMLRKSAQEGTLFSRNLLQRWRESGTEDRRVAASLRGFLIDHWGLRTAHPKEDFVDEHGYRIEEDPSLGYRLTLGGSQVSIEG